MKRPEFVGIWRDDYRGRAAYAEGAGIYRIVHRAVAVPSTTRDVVALVQWSGATGVPLVPRGAGSGMAGGNVGDGLIVDLTALNGAPLVVEGDRFQAHTGTAVALGALDEVAGRMGLRMPVDPSSARWVTAGGAVSTNAAGARSVKYGPVRRWVQGMTMVTADAEVVRLERGISAPDCELTRRASRELDATLKLARWRVASSFPKVRKNSSGYALDAFLESGDLLDLVIGAEGTLGIVTDVTWRLEPIPTRRAGVRAAIRDPRRLSHVVPAILELKPSKVEFLDRTFTQFVADLLRAVPGGAVLSEAAAVLMVEFEGMGDDTLDHDLERAVGMLKPESLQVQVGRDEREVETLWAIRRAASPKLASLGRTMRTLQVIEDGCVPLTRLGEYLSLVQSVSERHGVPVVLFGHAGDGNVHANLLPDVTKPGWEEAVRAIFGSVTQAVIAMGGSPSGEHGDGRLRAGLTERVFGWEIGQVLRQIKRVFDPAGIFNPGVKISAATDPLQSLKVGERAAPLPPDIEDALLRVERQTGYAIARLTLADDSISFPAKHDLE